MTSLRSALSGRDVVVCCGSGGVGKTTVAAVLGLAAAGDGRRAVVVTIDPARRLADALGLPGGLAPEPQRIEIEHAGAVSGGELWAMMLDPAVTFDGLVHQHAANEEQAARIIENRFYRNIASALSGTQEYMAAETLHALHGDDRFDVVIVDTPPSRHALDFLEAPGVLTRFLDHRLFRVMMLPARKGMGVFNLAAQPVLRAVGKVVGSDVLADAVAFFQAFAGMEGGFRDRADAVAALLRSDVTGFVLVASARHDTVVEAVWFARQLDRHEATVSAAIVNRVHPRFGTWSAAAAAANADEATSNGEQDGEHGGDSLGALWRNAAELAAIRDAELAVISPLEKKVGAERVSEVPLLHGDVHDLAALERIRATLFDDR